MLNAEVEVCGQGVRALGQEYGVEQRKASEEVESGGLNW